MGVTVILSGHLAASETPEDVIALQPDAHASQPVPPSDVARMMERHFPCCPIDGKQRIKEFMNVKRG